MIDSLLDSYNLEFCLMVHYLQQESGASVVECFGTAKPRWRFEWAMLQECSRSMIPKQHEGMRLIQSSSMGPSLLLHQFPTTQLDSPSRFTGGSYVPGIVCPGEVYTWREQQQFHHHLHHKDLCGLELRSAIRGFYRFDRTNIHPKKTEDNSGSPSPTVLSLGMVS